MAVRDTSFVRLLKPQWMSDDVHPVSLLPSIMPALGAKLRSVDNTSRWVFQRLGDERGGHVGLWFVTRHDVLAGLSLWLTEIAERGRLTIDTVRQVNPIEYFGEDPEIPIALAEASSELALGLIDYAALRADTRLLVSMHQLHHMMSLLRGDQAAFLFHCWQNWSRAFSPLERVGLVQAANCWAPGPVIAKSPHGYWQRYELRLREIAESRSLAGHILLEDAWKTHNRLDADAQTQALAALLLRRVLLMRDPSLTPRAFCACRSEQAEPMAAGQGIPRQEAAGRRSAAGRGRLLNKSVARD
ncbi:hypothetical protein AB5J62_24425 [Amycolatopsis sp. cg5]|uniref:hypothetical protein n=1 Tax=Amycolatopsis sp. cg5 TaxID=3238802 RepID=UPI0035258572